MNSFWPMILHSLLPTLITAGAMFYSLYFALSRGEPLFYLIGIGLGVSSLHQLAEINTWIKAREVPAPDWWFGDYPESILVILGVCLTFLLANYFERVNELLDEKNTLLEEIHHRVKNNLQTIMSLLSIEKNNAEAKQAKDALRQSYQRIRSIARVHEKLYETENVKKLDVAPYFEELCQELSQVFGNPDGDIDLKTSFDSLEMSLDRAIACGLSLNELVTNCYQHAFDDTRGTIEVTFNGSKGSMKKIIVRDNGVGIDFSGDRSESSKGLAILERLVTHDLDGDLRYEPVEDGTRIVITFP